MGLVAIVGLFLASRSHDATFSYFGLAVFAFGVVFIFGMIMRATAHPQRSDKLKTAER
jgi:hypothetical protein